MSPTLPADSSAVVPEPMYQEAFLICNLHTKAGGTALNQFYQELGPTLHQALLFGASLRGSCNLQSRGLVGYKMKYEVSQKRLDVTTYVVQMYDVLE